MIDTREPLKGVGVGGTGTGKSYRQMSYVKEEYSNPKNPNARKCLIYDVNEEYPDIKILAPEDIHHFNRQKQIEIRRILPKDKNGRELGMDDKYQLLCDIIDKHRFQNGMFWLEDINNYVVGANTKHLINLLTTNRQKFLDIWINVQTFGAVPPRIWGNLNILRIHKVNDDPFQSRIKSLISGKIEPLSIAHIMVEDKTQTDEYFCVEVDFRNLEITGAFTVPEFINSCEKYLALNPKLIKRQVTMNSISDEEAKKRLLVMFMDKYNGNVTLNKK